MEKQSMHTYVFYGIKKPWLVCKGSYLNEYVFYYSGNHESCSDKILIAR